MKYEEIKLGGIRSPNYLPVVAASIIFPLTVIFWGLNHFLGLVTSTSRDEGAENVPPSRWFMSIGVPVLFILYALRKKSLDLSGAALALFVGFFLTLSNYCFLVSLMIFFFSSSKATKFRAERKKKIEEDFKDGGQRNWIQVLCNGGMATELAILYLLDVGFGQRPIYFLKDHRGSWLSIGVLGALSCANGDTWASELGTVIGNAQPRLITSWRKVPRGTNGGVTIWGLVVSFLGGIAVGLGYYLTIIFSVDVNVLSACPSQLPVILIGGIGGLMGSIIDSFLGAIFQYSGIDSSGKIREVPGDNVKHISGFCLLDNHAVNLISTILTSLILPNIANSYWTGF